MFTVLESNVCSDIEYMFYYSFNKNIVSLKEHIWIKMYTLFLVHKYFFSARSFYKKVDNYIIEENMQLGVVSFADCFVCIANFYWHILNWSRVNDADTVNEYWSCKWKFK